MQQVNELSTMVVLESSRCLMADKLDSDTTMTLLALVSEDPSSWEEALSVWTRYRTPAVCEFASSLTIEETGREAAMEGLLAAEDWAVIDFNTKRIFTGGQFQEIGRDAAFAMVVDEGGEQPAFQLKEILQILANRYPALVSKSADLQSRLDEAARVVARPDSDLDIPF